MKTFEQIMKLETDAAHATWQRLVMFLCSSNEGLVYMQRGEADGLVDWAVRSDGAIIGGGDYGQPREIEDDPYPAVFNHDRAVYTGHIKHLQLSDVAFMIEANNTPEKLAQNRKNAYESLDGHNGINLDEWVNQGLNNIGLGKCPF
ncbi:MAG TPA: hypothetical protein VIY47_06990 [Ignavibacteriaceae bacterium]